MHGGRCLVFDLRTILQVAALGVTLLAAIVLAADAFPRVVTFLYLTFRRYGGLRMGLLQLGMQSLGHHLGLADSSPRAAPALERPMEQFQATIPVCALGTIGLPIVIDLVSISSLIARIPQQLEPRAPRLNLKARTQMLRRGQARVLQTVSRLRGGHRLLSATHKPSSSRRRIHRVSRQMRGVAVILPG